MENIDFSTLKKEYNILKDKDILFLNEFFNNINILKIINEIEQKRKKFLLIILLALIISIILIIFIFKIFDIQKNLNSNSGSFFIWLIIIGFFILFGILKSKFKSAIKGQVLSKMVKNISKDIEYDSLGKLFEDDFDYIAKNTKIINKFDRFDFKEDSIKIDNKEKGYLITATEFQTSKESTDSKGRKNHYVNNHAYIMKVEFYDPKYRVKNSINLFYKKNNNQLIIFPFFVFFTFLIISIINGQFTFEFNGQLKLIFFGFLIFIIGGIFIGNYFKNKNKIKLENIDFEKEFNVHSNDKIEVRQILNPAFMYRIYDYVNKINNKRKYNLYFNDNIIYIKHEISGDFLEISFFKSLLKNLKDYVEFYLEIKNIGELASDLKLSFYDKGFSSSNIIK